MLPVSVRKRSGAVVPFDSSRIARAIAGCFNDLSQTDNPGVLASVLRELTIAQAADTTPFAPTVESIQDSVERHLAAHGHLDAARTYIRYRDAHATQRQVFPVSPETADAFAASAQYFPTFPQQLQFYDKYSRFSYELGRRETWVETVDRSVDFLRELAAGKLDENVFAEIHAGILTMEVMPSMRLLAMAGPAARRNHVALYNCSYMAVDALDAFVEAMIISMCGTGVGYSVEQHYVAKLPIVEHWQTDSRATVWTVEDSSEGWANAWRIGLTRWFGGSDVTYDYAQVRPIGAPLMTKGGRASGPGPLKQLFAKARTIILGAQGRRLTALECHDIMCLVGDAAIQGGVRRTAFIALFSWGDAQMRHCKDGDLTGLAHRWNANNSEVWPDRQLSQQEVAEFVLDMHRSRRGEPGIFSRAAARRTKPARRQDAEFGTNPCGEIVLRPMEMCNLSSVVCRKNDGMHALRRKVRLATIIGTIQATATDFKGLRPQWKANCEDERLLGVDLNAQMDCPQAQMTHVQQELAELAVAVNRAFAQKLGINPAAAVTCVKPSGNSSVLLDASSGMHPRWSAFYVRNMRIGSHSPIFPVLKDAGVPMDPENGQSADTATTWVVHVPVQAPAGAVTRNDLTAIDQCNYWLQVKEAWCEHNPSVTITYGEHELLPIMQWIFTHQRAVGGMAFLPQSDFAYAQAPYEEIDSVAYRELAAAFPTVEFARLVRHEHRDLTTASQEIACSSGICEMP